MLAVAPNREVPVEGVVAPKREKPPPVAPAPVLAGAPKSDVEPLAGVLVVPNKPPPAEGVAVEEVPKDDPNEKLPRPLEVVTVPSPPPAEKSKVDISSTF